MGEQPSADFLAAFGITPASTEPAPATPEPITPEPAPATPEPITPAEPATPIEPATPAPTPEPNKQEFAFGQLRTENSKQKALIAEVAEILGIDPNATDAAEALKAKVLEAKAKAQNVPVQLLQDMDELKQQNAVYTAEQNRNRALLGFQQVKDNYALTDEQLQAFANELHQEGLNPFAQPVDLAKEYLFRHHAEITAKAKADGIREEALRAAAAAGQSTTPVPQSGGEPGSQEKINTVADLGKYLDSVQQ